MSPITTHVLDVARGVPAQGVDVRLDAREGDRWKLIGEDVTDADGRARELLDDGAAVHPGVYRLKFSTGEYFKRRKIKAFFPFVEIIFEVSDKRHHHVPLLLSPFGYSTYRGS